MVSTENSSIEINNITIIIISLLIILLFIGN